MIVVCPKCGTQNSIPRPPEPGMRYRCGNCQGTVVSFSSSFCSPPDKIVRAQYEKLMDEVVEAKPREVIHPTEALAVAPVQYAGLWRRICACILDIPLASGFVFITAYAVALVYSAARGVEVKTDFKAWLIVLSVVGYWCYWAVMESSSLRATFGKIATGIVVTDVDGGRISFWRATRRYIGKSLSVLTLFTGFIMIAFTKRKQGLRDRLAECLVVVETDVSTQHGDQQSPLTSPQQ
jgi:uncharacterized RDD family membrane protein YckC